MGQWNEIKSSKLNRTLYRTKGLFTELVFYFYDVPELTDVSSGK